MSKRFQPGGAAVLLLFLGVLLGTLAGCGAEATATAVPAPTNTSETSTGAQAILSGTVVFSSTGALPPVAVTNTSAPLVAPTNTSPPPIAPTDTTAPPTAAPAPPTNTTAPPPVAAPTNTSAPPPPAAGTAFILEPFFYTQEAQGDGWKVGTVDVATVNLGNRLTDAIQVENVQVNIETLEGKTYPGTLIQSMGNALSYGGYESGVRDYRLPSSPPATFYLLGDDRYPPQLPIALLTDAGQDRSGDGSQMHIQFRFAEAAHPLRIQITTSTAHFTLDLTTPSATDPEPPVASDVGARSLSDLARDLTQLNPQLQVEFGSCSNYQLPNRATNTDKFDQQQIAITFGVWYSSGTYDVETGPLFQAGPGQEVNANLGFSGLWGQPTYFVLYNAAKTAATLYKLGCTP